MLTRRTMMVLAGLVIVAGCQGETQTLNKEQDEAMNAAARRGRFEMGCPSATGTVLSRNVLQPAAWGGIERAEYTIGMDGCGKRSTYVSVCPVEAIGTSNCFAASAVDNSRTGSSIPP